MSLCDLVVAPPEELNQAESMAERISHERELAPFLYRNGILEPRTGRNRFLYGSVDVTHDKIEMNGGPVALVRTALLCLVIPALVMTDDKRGIHDLAAGSRVAPI